MNKDEALRLALEALEILKREFFKNGCDDMKDWEKHFVVPAMNAIAAIKQALEQPEPEPVAWTDEMAKVPDHVWGKRELLTDDEIQKITKSVAEKCADIADTAEPYRSGDLIRKHFGIKGEA